MPRAFRRIIANYRSNDVDDDDARVLELCAASQLQPEEFTLQIFYSQFAFISCVTCATVIRQ